jgi:hypothetical protein
MGFVLFTTASRSAVGPTQTPVQSVYRRLFSRGVRRPECEADHSHTSSAEAKNAWRYTSTPPVRLYGVVVLSQAQDERKEPIRNKF